MNLVLKKRGINFLKDDKEMMEHSDLKNYRFKLEFVGHNNEKVTANISRCEKGRARYKTHVHFHRLSFYGSFEDPKDGLSHVYKEAEAADYIHKNDLEYNKKDVLNLVNYLSKDSYTEVEIVEY